MAYNTPDYSGLQVSDRQNGHRVAYTRAADLDHSYPEVHAQSFPEAANTWTKSYPEVVGSGLLPPKYVAYHEISSSNDNNVEGKIPVEKKRFSRRCWVVFGIIAVVVIAAVVGAVVGVVVGKGSSSSSTSGSSSGSDSSSKSSPPNGAPGSDNSTSSLRSACRDIVCPQILAAAQAQDQLMVFARGTDNNIWYNMATASSISPWPASQSWQNLAGGPFLSQPHAVAFNSSKRIAVAAVADPDHSARTQIFTREDMTFLTGWKNLKGRLTSPVTMCAVRTERLDFWASSADNLVVAHNFLDRFKNTFWSPDETDIWQGSADWKPDPTTKGRPAIACRTDDFGHDILVYDGTGKSAKYTSYSDKTSWTPIFTLDSGASFSGFQGDPVLLASANDKLDFFGIGVDKAMYYGAWSKKDGHAALVNLGGSFQSVPSAIVTKGGRVDVVALGTNDTLMHRVRQGSRWSAEWEDLGVFGNSAPLALNLTTNPESVALFVLGTNGELNQTVWTVSQDETWKGLKWKSMGGALTSSFFRR